MGGRQRCSGVCWPAVPARLARIITREYLQTYPDIDIVQECNDGFEGVKAITQHKFEVVRIVRLDEKNRQIYYLARSAPNPYYYQLHRVGMDGSGDTRLTDPEWHHTVDLAPDGKHFTDAAELRDRVA